MAACPPPSRNMSHSEIIAAGIDGCRVGWVAAIARRDTTTELRLFDDLEAVVRWRDREAGVAMVGVDVPMGLPPRAGPRPCDRDARRELGPRWMCVFAPPDRELLGLDFAHAREVVNRRRRLDPAGDHPVMTHQTINIAPKIAEADRLLRADPRRQGWLLEVHPELSFQALAGATIEPKRTSAGAAARLALVARQFPDAPRRLGAKTWSRAEVARDDLLDAYAVLWTALRFARGTGHYRELGDGRRDAYGLRQRIVI
jgi:predicted RNase H-like nuclease